MSSIVDDLLNVELRDRVHYETGVLLNAEDFIAEQSYHRGRLSRALQYLSGAGTVAGLRVEHEPAIEETDTDPARDARIVVGPGMAVDYIGRIIEIPRHQCMRIDRWYEQQSAADLAGAWHPADEAWAGAPAGVVLDLLVHFINCKFGKTPSFAVGPFDSLDAVTADRIREGASVQLVFRDDDDLAETDKQWPDFAAAADPAAELRNAILDAWKTPDEQSQLQVKGVLLARVAVHAAEAQGDDAPQRETDNGVSVNNDVRPFLVPTSALAQWVLGS